MTGLERVATPAYLMDFNQKINLLFKNRIFVICLGGKIRQKAVLKFDFHSLSYLTNKQTD